MSRSVGRPLKYDSITVLKQMITRYFKSCEERKKPPTITGLAHALGTNRQTLCNIENLDRYPAEFVDTIKEAKQMCEIWIEEAMLTGNANVTAAIFTLKNNFGWEDKQSREHKHDHTHRASDTLSRRRQRVVDGKQQLLPQSEPIEVESDESCH